MSTEMNATETVQRARGYMRCPEGCWFWVFGPHIDGDHNAAHIVSLPDPLADTPEGWWEFGQILEWAHREGFEWEVSGGWWTAYRLDPTGSYAQYGTAEGPERKARIEALGRAAQEGEK